MPINVILWNVIVPALIAGVVLVLGWQPWRKNEAGERPGLKRFWVPGIAVGLGYLVGHWGTLGGPGETNDIAVWLIFLTVWAGILGVLEESLNLPQVMRWPLRVVSGMIFAWLLLRPLFGSTLSQNEGALAMAAVAAAFVLVWGAIAWSASAEEGPFFVVLQLLIAGATSVTLILSALATSGQAIGALIAPLVVLLLFSWRYRCPGQFKGLAPVLATVLVGHWTIAVGYAEMPRVSYILLVLGIMALVKLPLMLQMKFRRALAMVSVVLAILVPSGIAAGLAGAHYFADTPAEEGTDDDYGYD